jgi:SAM-dependent methyltransferase
MSTDFSNVYDDELRAKAYATLEYPGTYYLAFRDLSEIIGPPGSGKKALDFGCGAGRSTRFMRKLGFDVIGVDIAEHMLVRARQIDPSGDYRLVSDGTVTGIAPGTCEVVLSAFTFDNIPTQQKKRALLESLRHVLAEGGRIINLVSAPDIYVHEWASFSTRQFPENRTAQNGETVKIVMLDVDDKRPVEDILWTDVAYRQVYQQAGLTVLSIHRPLGSKTEPYAWVSETSISPWVIYVLGAKS